MIPKVLLVEVAPLPENTTLSYMATAILRTQWQRTVGLVGVAGTYIVAFWWRKNYCVGITLDSDCGEKFFRATDMK